MEKIIEIYVDGACVPNPGKAAIGVVLRYGRLMKEHMDLIGYGTNNIAEITAIKHGLEMVKNRTYPVKLYSDSLYAINTLSGKWRAKVNIDLIRETKELLETFDSVELIWVRGHAGNQYQERADELANMLLTGG